MAVFKIPSSDSGRRAIRQVELVGQPLSGIAVTVVDVPSRRAFQTPVVKVFRWHSEKYTPNQAAKQQICGAEREQRLKSQ